MTSIPLIVTFDPVRTEYTVDHPKRRHLNKVKLVHVRAKHLTVKDVRGTRMVGRECFFDRDKDIVYLGDDEYELSKVHFNQGPMEANRYFCALLGRCGLGTWLQALH